jgi:hypothetical protein
VPAHSSTPLTVTLDSFAVDVDSDIAKLPSGTVDPTNSYYRASTDQYGTYEHPGLTFT